MNVVAPKKVLITGVAGFLGSNLLAKLITEGHTVIGIDNLSRGRLTNMEPYLEHERFTFLEEDITDEDVFSSLDRGINLIVHLAAFKIPRYGNTLATLRINSQGTEQVLEFAQKLHCKCVLASTSDVYGMSTRLPFREDDVHVIGDSQVPRWAYAVSKLFDEHLALAYMEAHGFPVVIMRLFGSYGPQQHLSWWGGPQAVFIENILTGQAVPIHGDGSQTRTFTFVDDTIAGIYACMMNPRADGEVFNIGAQEEVSILDLAHLIKRLSGTPGDLKVEFIPYDQISKGRRYQDVMRRVPDVTKLRTLLGIEAQVSLEEGLRRTMVWQSDAMGVEVEKGLG